MECIEERLRAMPGKLLWGLICTRSCNTVQNTSCVGFGFHLCTHSLTLEKDVAIYIEFDHFGFSNL